MSSNVMQKRLHHIGRSSPKSVTKVSTNHSLGVHFHKKCQMFSNITISPFFTKMPVCKVVVGKMTQVGIWSKIELFLAPV